MVLISYSDIRFNKVNVIANVLRTELKLSGLTVICLARNRKLGINRAEVGIRMHNYFICAKRQNCCCTISYIGQ